MARVFSRNDRRGKKVFYIDYPATNPATGVLVRKKERIGYSKAQAHDALTARLTDIRRGKFDGIFPDPDCFLADVWPRYLEHSTATKSPAQVTREEGILKDHLTDEFGAIPLNRITAEQVEAYQARRKDEKKAASTINKEVQLLKNVSKKAIEWGFMKSYMIQGGRLTGQRTSCYSRVQTGL